MAYLQLGGQQLPLRVGAQRIGPDSGADVQLPSGPPTATAIVEVGADNAVVIRRASSDSIIKVNGVALGAEPSPLIHGDRIDIGGHELRFGDNTQAGSTQFVSSSAISDAIRARANVPSKPTTATGGRLVSLVDGREYTVSAAGLTIGRDPAADVVVPSSEVSRKHVHIAPAVDGYMLTDLSTNGVWVNGTRVAQQQVLGRGDIIKVGAEEFRFYADAAKQAGDAPRTSAAAAPPPPPPPPPVEAPRPTAPRVPPAAPPTAAAPPAPPAAPPRPAPPAAPPPPAPPARPSAPPPVAPAATARPAAPSPPPPAAPRPAPAPAAPAPAAPPAPPAPSPAPAPASAPARPAAPPVVAAPARPSTRPPLALLEIINEGPLKGTTVEVHSPLTNIGRGEHNDLVIASESVSDSHAKLQKREDGWYIVDVNSTNGTYVGGRRIQGEQRLEGAPDLRFGDIKVAFRPRIGAGTGEEKSTKVISAAAIAQAKRAAATSPVSVKSPASAKSAPRPKSASTETGPVSSSGTNLIGAWVALAVIAAAAVVWWLFLRGA